MGHEEEQHSRSQSHGWQPASGGGGGTGGSKPLVSLRRT
jgi:hypothetical protein